LLNKKLIDAKFKITNLNIEKDKLLNSKEKIDVTIIELNPSKLASDIEILTKSGIALKEKLGLIKEKIKEIGVITFDEDEHHELTKNLTKNTSELAVKKSEVDRLKSVVDELIAGGICKSCNRKLDTVDNTEHIKKHEKDIDILNKNIDKIKIIIDGLNTKLEGIVIIKKRIDEKNKLELDSDRVEVEMGGLRNQIVSKSNDLKKYNLNLEAIELNKKVDIQISLVKTNLQVEEHTKDETITRIERIVNDIKNNKTSIELKKKLIETIKKEEEVEKIFKIYIDLVGKKGISKLVLRSVLPIINSEVQRLLENVCDFEIEIFMDDKNDVQFLINRDGVSKMLKSASGFEKTASSIALRTVLCKMSTLPMPNFISFDEVLGKVAPDNIDKLKSLFDKIKDMYDIVFLITHNDAVLDWSDRIITVVKENNISKIIVK
jgi:DNA repair exonuclease SbcCD ATPase subunit